MKINFSRSRENYFVYRTITPVIISACFLLFSFTIPPKSDKKTFTIVFYNVENLFDTENTPGKSEGEFTPEGSKKWTQERYLKKAGDISKVLSSVGGGELPEVIGMCEIENRKAVEDVVKAGELAKGGYQVVHYESPDARGIDNALAYRPDEFKVTWSQAVPVIFEGETKSTTRDILYVKGKTLNNEEFHIFVNHWPSRIGGEDETELKRMAAALVLKQKTDSLLALNPKTNIVIIGDMNDEPANKSLLETLGAKDYSVEPAAKLFNLMFEVDKQDLGSYSYRGQWNMLDNIVVSPGLLDNSGFRCPEKQGFVFHQEWMEFKNRNGAISPNRTYGGDNYYGGVSDHFPVFVKFVR